MSASASDLLQEVGIATATTLDSNYTISDSTVTVASTSGWPTATGVTFAIDVVDANGVQVAGSYNEYVGTVATATSVSNVSHANGTDRNYSAGATTRVYIPVSAERENRIVEWGVAEHNQDGTHSDVTADSITTNAGGSVDFSETPLATTDIDDNAVTASKLALGTPVQEVSVGYSAVATGTTAMVLDDTIPQNTEGDEYMTLAITPKSATNILVIDVVIMLSCSAQRTMAAAIFQDSTANAVAANVSRLDAIDQPTTFSVRHRMVAGTTSATTFKVRGGAIGAGTTTFNGASGTRLFGAITKSSIVITEYKAS